MRALLALLFAFLCTCAPAQGRTLRQIVISAPELKGWTQVEPHGSHSRPHATVILDLEFARSHAHLTLTALRFDSERALRAALLKMEAAGQQTLPRAVDAAGRTWPLRVRKGRDLVIAMVYEAHPERGEQGMRPGVGMALADLRRLVKRVLNRLALRSPTSR